MFVVSALQLFLPSSSGRKQPSRLAWTLTLPEPWGAGLLAEVLV